jgi:hypothetical protein
VARLDSWARVAIVLWAIDGTIPGSRRPVRWPSADHDLGLSIQVGTWAAMPVMGIFDACANDQACQMPTLASGVT